jgi:hypothetical protein
LVFIGGCPIPFDDLPELEVSIFPRLPHAEALAWMGRAHVLLVVNPGNAVRYAISGKLFEYLAARRPILAIVPEDGASADLLRQTRAGVAASPDQPDRIVAALESCLRMASNYGSFKPDTEAVAEFARPRLTAKLTTVFDAVVAESRKKQCSEIPVSLEPDQTS